MNYITPFTNYLSGLKTDTIISNKEMLKLASLLNNTHIDHHLIELPKLIVVGTQSSGKSSLLNALIGMDILPVGKTMTTRTPLHLDLIQSTDSRIEFGTFDQLQWTSSKKIPFTTLSTDQRDLIKHEIEHQTNLKAGSALNISHEPIFMKIYAPGVPNLSFVDLPGLTSIAMTDRGQPKDIKEQIIKLVSNTIQSKNAIILAIIAARPDIEADMAMEIVKKADPTGERTIGILTKLDLMNEDADISCYLENQLSIDLTLKYGYYGVKNRNNPSQSIQDALVSEKNYFQTHTIYRQEKYKSRLGINTVATNVSNILIHNIKCCLPHVLSNITKQLDKTNEEMNSLGKCLPLEKEARFMILNSMVAKYVKTFQHAIESRGSSFQTGRMIKEKFISYRREIQSINPFNELKDQDLIDRLKGYDGIHMSFPYVPLEVIETCLTDRTWRPIMRLMEPSQKCLKECLDLLQKLLFDIDTDIKKYPNLLKSIRNIVINDIFIPCYQTTLLRIKERMKSEEAYIWTDDKSFHKVMSDFSGMIKNGEYDITKLKNVLYEYYKTVVNTMCESIPKCIVFHLIQDITKQVNFVIEKVVSSDINVLLEEFPEIEQRRKELDKNKKELSEIKKQIELIL
jgi:dynamin 1-like protein